MSNVAGQSTLTLGRISTLVGDVESHERLPESDPKEGEKDEKDGRFLEHAPSDDWYERSPDLSVSFERKKGRRQRLTLKGTEELEQVENRQHLRPNQRRSARQELCRALKHQLNLEANSGRVEMRDGRKDSIRNRSERSVELVPQSAQRYANAMILRA